MTTSTALRAAAGGAACHPAAPTVRRRSTLPSAAAATAAPRADHAARAPSGRSSAPHCGWGTSPVPHAQRRRPIVVPAAAEAEPAPTAPAAAAAAPLSGFRLAPEEVDALLRQSGGSVDNLLLSLLPAAARLARPPISNYHVG